MASYYHSGGRFSGARRGGRGRSHGSGHTHQHITRISDETGDDVFQVHRPQEYLGPTPLMEQPQVLGCYSIDEDRTFGHDRTILKFIEPEYMPQDGKIKVLMDLNKGWGKNKLYSGNSEDTFNNLLRWMLSNQEMLLDQEASSQRLDVDFVCARGCLSTLMRSPYDIFSRWKILAKCFRRTTYMILEKTEPSFVDPNSQPSILEKTSVWGHKFEHYMTGGDPDSGFCANEEFRCVLQNKLGNFSLIYAPEVDGADPEIFEEEFKDLRAFVTVKCCRQVDPLPRKMENFRKFKLLLWWTENKLSGIPCVVVGYRDDDGIVHSLETFRTDDLPNIAKELWQPEVCLNFLSTMLGYIKRQVEENPKAIHRFERESMTLVRHSTLPDISTSTAGALGLTGLHFSILPPWYLDQMFSPPETVDAENEPAKDDVYEDDGLDDV